MTFPINFVVLGASALVLLSGCRVDMSGAGVLTDLSSQTTQALKIEVLTPNRGQACEVSLSLSTTAGAELLSIAASPMVMEQGHFSINTTQSPCDSSAPIVIAQGQDRTLSVETVERVIQCNPSNPPMGNPSFEGRPELRRIRVRLKTVVTDVQGEIRNRASGVVTQTFTATSDPRVEEQPLVGAYSNPCHN